MNMPTLEGFRAFVASKPADEHFDYASNYDCAFGQYLKSLGLRPYPANDWKGDYIVGGHDWADFRGGHKNHPLPFAPSPSDRTFGRLRTRMEAIDAPH